MSQDTPPKNPNDLDDDYTRTPRNPPPDRATPPPAQPHASRRPDRTTYARDTKDPKESKERRAQNPKKDKPHDDDHEPSLWDRTIGKRIDGLVPDLIKRTLTGTFGSLFMSEDGLRQTLSDLKMPKELIQHILQQADHTKRELMQTIARELREFLEVSNFYEELQRILTSLSFEIRTQIRLVPNDEAIVKPEVKNKVNVRMDPREPRPNPPPSPAHSDETQNPDEDL